MAQSHQVDRCPQCGKPRLITETTCGHCRYKFPPPVQPFGQTSNPFTNNPPLTPKVIRDTLLGVFLFFAFCGFGGWYIVTLPDRRAAEQNEPPPATARDIRFGMSKNQVRDMLGSPDYTQEMHSRYGSEDTWYFGEWQVNFSRGYVESVNRF